MRRSRKRGEKEILPACRFLRQTLGKKLPSEGGAGFARQYAQFGCNRETCVAAKIDR
jgi:hypothetical protein